MKIPKKPNKPWHWCVLFGVSAFCTAWMLYPDPVTKIIFQKPTSFDLQQPSAIHADSLSLLSDQYKERLLMFSNKAKELCSSMSRNVIFGHNVRINNETVLDHIFHHCGGKTWLNANIIERGDSNVICKEEYAKIYKKREQPRSVVIRGINIDKWSVEQVSSSSAKQSCTWQHAIDILNRNWN